MRVGGPALKPAASTVALETQVYPSFMTLLERRGQLSGWLTQWIHKITDVVIDEGVHSGAGRPKTFYDVNVKVL